MTGWRLAPLRPSAARLFAPALRRMTGRAPAFDNHACARAHHAAHVPLTFWTRFDRRFVDAVKPLETMAAALTFIFVCWHISPSIKEFHTHPPSAKTLAPFRIAEIVRHTACLCRNASRHRPPTECALKMARSWHSPPVRRRRF